MYEITHFPSPCSIMNFITLKIFERKIMKENYIPYFPEMHTFFINTEVEYLFIHVLAINTSCVFNLYIYFHIPCLLFYLSLINYLKFWAIKIPKKEVKINPNPTRKDKMIINLILSVLFMQLHKLKRILLGM